MRELSGGCDDVIGVYPSGGEFAVRLWAGWILDELDLCLVSRTLRAQPRRPSASLYVPGVTRFYSYDRAHVWEVLRLPRQVFSTRRMEKKECRWMV